MRIRAATARVTVTFSDDALDWLNAEADRRAVSIADLIRRIVDETRGSFIRQPRAVTADTKKRVSL